MAMEIHKAGERFHTKLDWLDSWHSFSFGHHYDSVNTGHGLLIVNNDDTVRAGGGFGTHSHRDMEIVTWVLDGELRHRDSTGTDGVIYPGLAQRISAGSGISHSEMNASDAADVHFVQMWVIPDRAGFAPSYEQLDVNDELASGELVQIASGQGEEGTIAIHQRDAELYVGRLAPGKQVAVPGAPHAHVFVAIGSAALDGVKLDTGDAARLTDEDALWLVSGADGAEVLVWETA
jgi:redox-sensitive bicupin YhaK (pirin superfamily)